MIFLRRLLDPVLMPLLGATLLSLMSALGWIWLQSGWYDDLAQENDALTSQIETCTARITNIIEDAKDDALVNDPLDFVVPDGWLLPSED